MNDTNKVVCCGTLVAITAICLYFHFVLGENTIIFWVSSIVGTVAIIVAAFPAVDLIMDRMYGLNRYEGQNGRI
jgi:hypothetical protein